MSITKNSLSSKFLYISLVGSLSVLFFGITVFISGTAFSWLARIMNFSIFLSSLQLWQYLILVGLPVFFLANLVLYFSENIVEKRFDSLLQKFNRTKVISSFVVFLCLSVLVYFFGFNWYINFIYRTFWI